MPPTTRKLEIIFESKNYIAEHYNNEKLRKEREASVESNFLVRDFFVEQNWYTLVFAIEQVGSFSILRCQITEKLNTYM